MLKTLKIISTTLAFTFISATASSATYVTATPARINVNEPVTIDWSRYYPNRYPNQTYNLYVYKPSNEPKYKYRSGLKTTSDVRGPITMSGYQTIQVEVCDQYGQNCYSNSYGRTRVFVDHQCEYKYFNSFYGSAYVCDGNVVTQNITTNYDPLSLPDSISDFISIKGRLFWKFTENSRTYNRVAWYTSCRSGGEIKRVTELLDNQSFPGSPGRYDRIDNFVPRSSGERAEWTFYDAWWGTSTERSADLGKCS